MDAWTAQPSVYAVAARSTAHVVAAINFAREKNLRLVVKGGGHSYLGTSNAADSLLIWTCAMNDVAVHDAFVPQGCAGRIAPVPAVTVGAGAILVTAPARAGLAASLLRRRIDRLQALCPGGDHAPGVSRFTRPEAAGRCQ